MNRLGERSFSAAMNAEHIENVSRESDNENYGSDGKGAMCIRPEDHQSGEGSELKESELSPEIDQIQEQQKADYPGQLGAYGDELLLFENHEPDGAQNGQRPGSALSFDESQKAENTTSDEHGICQLQTDRTGSFMDFVAPPLRQPGGGDELMICGRAEKRFSIRKLSLRVIITTVSEMPPQVGIA